MSPHHRRGNPLQFLFKLSMVFMSSSLNSKSNSWQKKQKTAKQVRKNGETMLCVKEMLRGTCTSQSKCCRSSVTHVHTSWTHCSAIDVTFNTVDLQTLVYLEILHDVMRGYWLGNDSHVPLDVEPHEYLDQWKRLFGHPPYDVLIFEESVHTTWEHWRLLIYMSTIRRLFTTFYGTVELLLSRMWSVNTQ